MRIDTRRKNRTRHNSSTGRRPRSRALPSLKLGASIVNRETRHSQRERLPITSNPAAPRPQPHSAHCHAPFSALERVRDSGACSPQSSAGKAPSVHRWEHCWSAHLTTVVGRVSEGIHHRTPIVAKAPSLACGSATVAYAVYARFSHSRGLSVHPRVPWPAKAQRRRFRRRRIAHAAASSRPCASNSRL
jgi:hypothetical protein